MIKGNFIDNLPKVYGIYTGGFIAFIILMAIGEQMGMSAKAIGICFVGFTIFIYAAIGWLSRTAQASNYYVAGRQVPTVFNGMATAADWMSGASFVAMAGGIYFKGYGYMALLVGWTGGYVLVATLLAPYLRKFGCYTVPDFVGTRYGGNAARLLAVIVLTVASFTYVTAQINATGYYCFCCFRYPIPIRSIRWTNKYFIMFNAWWYERGNLDTGCTIHCANHSLPTSSILDQ
jgi:cation/acetate symporter